MATSVLQRGFIGGEISPANGARADLVQYAMGLRRCRNFIVQRSGGVTKRPGSLFLTEVKDSDVLPRLIPYTDEANQATFALEFGEEYIRFIKTATDALVLDGSDVFEVETPYQAGDLAALQWSQFGNVLTITCAGHPQAELIHVDPTDDTDWVYEPITVEPGVDPPENVTAEHAPGNVGALNMRYVVTAIKAATFEESYASAVAEATGGAEPTVAAPNPINWDASDGAVEYVVYCDPYQNGIFGFIGRQKPPSTFFSDVGFLPDYTQNPPEPPMHPMPPGYDEVVPILFGGENLYPSVVTHHQQRIWYAGPNANRETAWGSQVGAPHNFSVSTPLQDDDAISFQIASALISPIRHLVSLQDLVVLTDAGAWRAFGDERGALTPLSITLKQDSYYAPSIRVRPVVNGNTLVYVQARGSGVRDLRYDQGPGGLFSTDLTLLAQHLVRGFQLQDLDFTLEPFSTVWVIRGSSGQSPNDAGVLLGCTYIPEQDVVAWHRHTTGSAQGRPEDECIDWEPFEDLCAIPHNASGQDRLYFVVKRTIGGEEKRYIERFANVFHPETTAIKAAVFVDSAITVTGPTTSITSGLDHLEGRVVAVLADGKVIFDGDPSAANAAAFTVSGGGISATFAAATVVQVGLPIRFAEIETLDLDAPGAAIRDLRKKVQGVTVLVYGTATDTADLQIGPDAAHLLAYRREAWEASETWRTAALEINITDTYRQSGRLLLRHTTPLPCTIVGVMPRVEAGG